MAIKSYIPALIGSLAALMGFTACQDDVDAPALTEPVATIEANTSIIDLKTKYWSDESNYIDTVRLTEDGEHVVIAGRVVSSDEAGNIYKNLVIQDKSAAITLSINANSLYNQYRIGQEVVIDVTDMYIGKYSSLQQFGFPDYATGYGWQATFMPYEFFLEHAQLNGLPDAAKVDTMLTTIDQLPNDAAGLRKWQSQLVRFNNVHFEEGGQAAFCSEHQVTTSRNLLDENGNTIVVRTSGYARFWSTMLPEGNGDVVGILSYYGSGSSAVWQLQLRSVDDLMNFGNPTLPVGTEDNPYTINEAIAFAAADKPMTAWTKGYIVGAVKAEVSEVSGDNDIEWGAPTEMNNTLIIGQDSTTTTLDEAMLVRLPQGSKLRELANLRDNPGVYRKQIIIYGSFATDMGTFAITNNQGTLNEFKIDGLDLGGAIPNGNGTEASPYSAGQVNAMGSSATATDVFVKGYIVGWIDNSSQTYADENNCNFTAPATVATNLLLANTPDVKDYKECIAVNLPSGAIRTALNLQNNPGNLGKWVVVRGNIIKYFTLPGVKELTAYTLQDGDSSTTPPATVDPVSSIDETFEGGSIPSTWTQVQVAGNKSWYTPSFDNNYYASMTGYNGTAPFDQWLITPPIDMSKVSDKVLSFITQVNGYGSTTSSLEVYVLTSNDVTTATKTRLNPTLATAPASGYSSWVNSGDLSLSSFSGIVYIGFRYYATQDANYATWCVDNVKVGIKGSGSGSGSEDPDTPDTPDLNLQGEGTEANPYTVADIFTINPSEVNLPGDDYPYADKWVEGYIVGSCTSAVISSATFSTDNASGTNILLAPTADCTDIDQCIAVQLPASPSSIRAELSLKNNPDMYKKHVLLQGDVLKYFSRPGFKNTSAYKVK